MYCKKTNITALIAPLDWGLGHVTRCIPIINVLLQKKCTVLIAATGAHKILLQLVFPQLKILDLSGYNIKYAKKNVLLKLAMQLPKVCKIIKNEHIWLGKMIDEHKIDLVITDNRYGLWSKKIPCAFITHQLQLDIPSSFYWAERTIQKILYRWIEKFSICWVPDITQEMGSLSGKLGHPEKMPNIIVSYIGPLSRFAQKDLKEKKYKVMVCLSGPEPQRSLLESIILPQLKKIIGQVLLVRGKPDSAAFFPTENNITIKNHLSTNEMQQAFEQSEYVVSRCGYSTLMDMQVLQCKCIYIPTPNQTEQEYLGKRLTEAKMAIVCKQQDFDLKNALEQAANFNFQTVSLPQNDALEIAVEQLLKMVQPLSIKPIVNNKQSDKT